jgi:hypothetical protein
LTLFEGNILVASFHAKISAPNVGALGVGCSNLGPILQINFYNCSHVKIICKSVSKYTRKAFLCYFTFLKYVDENLLLLVNLFV